MIEQPNLPLHPRGAEILGPDISLFRDNGMLYFFNGSSAVYTCKKEDKKVIRIVTVMLISLKLVKPSKLAKCLGVHRSTIYRNQIIYEKEGIDGLVKDVNREIKPYKLNDEVCKKIEKLLDAESSIRKTSKEMNISEGAIRNAIKKGRIKHNKKGASEDNDPNRKVSSPAERAEEDHRSNKGVGVKRKTERVQASKGAIKAAKPQFKLAEGVKNLGVLLALPALLHEGLSITEKVYGKLKNGFFGLKSILLLLSFAILLRIKTIEQIKSQSPGELGLLLGLDRAAEIKTIRRKLKEIGELQRVAECKAELLEYWLKLEPESLGFLYIDGHVRPYHGKKYTLPKTFVSRRHLAMPATTDFCVNDEKNAPLFFVTAPANNSLLSMLDEVILSDIQNVNEENREITLIFDREGWSPRYFKKWKDDGIDIITYRKGKYNDWPLDCFFEVEGEYNGKKVKYMLGERSIKMKKGFWVREVRRLCDNGHQTSIITTRQDSPLFAIAQRMFSRWNQENYFKYMRHEFNLDHLCTYDVEPADENRPVPNPEKKKNKKELAAKQKELANLEQECGKDILLNPDNENMTIGDYKKDNSDLADESKNIRNQCEEIEKDSKKIPEKVPLNKIMDTKDIVKLEEERKVFIDMLKIIAYRSETFLAEMIEPFFSRYQEESRTFLKTAFQLTGDMMPDESNDKLVIRLYGVSTKRDLKVLQKLCEMLNKKNTLFPGTKLRMVYESL